MNRRPVSAFVLASCLWPVAVGAQHAPAAPHAPASPGAKAPAAAPHVVVNPKAAEAKSSAPHGLKEPPPSSHGGAAQAKPSAAPAKDLTPAASAPAGVADANGTRATAAASKHEEAQRPMPSVKGSPPPPAAAADIKAALERIDRQIAQTPYNARAPRVGSRPQGPAASAATPQGRIRLTWRSTSLTWPSELAGTIAAETPLESDRVILRWN